MKALVLHDSPITQARIASELMGKGFQVIALGSQAAAREWLGHEMVDVLVMDECVGSSLTHSLALSAERRNPFVSVVMLTERIGEDAEELYLLIPCLYSLLGRDNSPQMIARLAMASVINVAETEERVRSRKLWFAAQDADDPEPDYRTASDLAEDFDRRADEPEPDPVAAQQLPLSTHDFVPEPAVSDLASRVPAFLSRTLGPVPVKGAGVTAASLPDWSDKEVLPMAATAAPERRLHLG